MPVTLVVGEAMAWLLEQQTEDPEQWRRYRELVRAQARLLRVVR